MPNGGPTPYLTNVCIDFEYCVVYDLEGSIAQRRTRDHQVRWWRFSRAGQPASNYGGTYLIRIERFWKWNSERDW